VADAAKAMREHGIGDVLIDDGQLKGALRSVRSAARTWSWSPPTMTPTPPCRPLLQLSGGLARSPRHSGPGVRLVVPATGRRHERLYPAELACLRAKPRLARIATVT
jgi:hypothetical protein